MKRTLRALRAIAADVQTVGMILGPAFRNAWRVVLARFASPPRAASDFKHRYVEAFDDRSGDWITPADAKQHARDWN